VNAFDWERVETQYREVYAAAIRTQGGSRGMLRVRRSSGLKYEGAVSGRDS